MCSPSQGCILERCEGTEDPYLSGLFPKALDKATMSEKGLTPSYFLSFSASSGPPDGS